jgi:orotate phosphoribosyltransferase
VTATTIPVDRAALAGDLGRGGYLRGAFPRDGGQTRLWFQNELVLTRPGVLARCADLLTGHVPARADRLAARGAAATALAAALALRTDLALLLEPDVPGDPARFAGDSFPGARILLVEDVVMTGAHALASITSLRGQGMDVLGVLAVVDRERGARGAVEDVGVPLTVLFSERELVR